MSRSFTTTVTTSEDFQSYEDDCRRLQRSLREDIATASSARNSPEERAAAASRASESHESAMQALMQMELEAKSMGTLSSSLTPKLKDYRSELTASRRKIRDVHDALRREGLNLNGRHGRETNEMEDKVLNDTYSRLRGSSRRLDDARRNALEAEEIGLDVMGELQSQRESIHRTKAHLQDTDSTLGLSKRVLQTMGYRMQSNQMMLGCIALVLAITLVLVIYFKINKIMGGHG
mmetsp:Transcript_21716/g.38178  ORF Transcript_21716/g.38178 Transcript_21716/m.38178 type:complete len:234 (-) Transcript_21716:57-758(-)